MKKLSSLAFRYMKMNKNRTGTTLIGIVLSVILIYSIFACGGSIYENSAKKAYIKNLAWDAVFVCDGDTAREIVLQAEYYGGQPKGDVPKLTHAWIMAASGNGNLVGVNDFNALQEPITLLKGTTPSGSKGVVATLSTCRGQKLTVGDSISLIDQDGLKTEKIISGIYDEEEWFVSEVDMSINPSWGELVLMTEEMYESDSLTVYVVFDDKRDLKGQTEKLANLYGVEKYYVSNSAKNYFYRENGVESVEYLLTQAMLLLIAAIVGIAVIFLVRNAFNISVYERNNDYGILRCIGLSQRQIVRVILYEAIVLAAVGTVIGILIGQGCCVLGFWFVKTKLKIDVFLVFRVRNIFITAGFMLVVTFYSMISPIQRLYKLNPIEALRKIDEIKLKKPKKKVLSEKQKERLARKQAKRTGRRGRILGKLFGVEIAYAYKNGMRTKGRFLLSIVSLSLGTALFVGGSTGIKSIYNSWYADAVFMGAGYDGCFSADTYREALNIQKEMEGLSCIEDTVVSSYWMWWQDGIIAIGVNEKTWKELLAISTKSEAEEGKDDINVISLGLAKSQGDDKVIQIEGKDLTLHSFAAADDGEAAKILIKCSDYADYETIQSNEVYIYQLGGAIDQLNATWNWGNDYRMFYSVRVAFYPGKSTYLFDNYVINSMYFYDDYEMAHEFKLQMSVVRYASAVIILMVLVLFLVNITNTQRAQLILRRKEFEILQVIGMSSKQKRKMLYAETMLMVILALILGCILGLAAAYGVHAIMFKLLNINEENLIIPALSIDGWSILISAVLLLGVGFLVAFASSAEEMGKD